jgi:hypothetical protein
MNFTEYVSFYGNYSERWYGCGWYTERFAIPEDTHGRIVPRVVAGWAKRQVAPGSVGRRPGEQVRQVPEHKRGHSQDDHDLYAPLRREASHRQRPEPDHDANLRERTAKIQDACFLDLASVWPEERYPRRARHQPEDHDGQVAGYAEQE